ncbi:TonB-dependent siderophore receptor [Pelistega suis]|uniref:TonB-dependent siderophore receptor n=1 Tax=Pelistega suis TaxID=1631957 RepID=UPI00211B91C0|nr:TonB-dependent siderophore receptor [Pelistega suis]MCQ9329506.1 TonB-dependent siderophore receptor [Pelistega suis]
MQGFRLKKNVWVLAILFSTTSFAQEVSPSSVATLEEVEAVTERIYDAIVTEKTRDYSSFASTVGTKRPEAIREIPQSISIITHQQLQDREVKTFDQLAAKTPGLRVLANDDGRSSVYARGYEYSEYNIDGLPAQMQSLVGTLPNLIAFDRIEIMRGPSGLFDSSGEMGGIVNFVRKRPTHDFQGSVGAGFGSYKKYNLDGDISGALNTSGTLRGRLIAQTNGESPRPAKQNNHHETIYAALDWDITPQTTLGLGYLYQQRKLSPNNGLPAYAADNRLLSLPERTFVGADWNDFGMKSHDVFADLKHYFDNDAHAKMGIRYSDRDADSNYIFSGTGLNPANRVRIAGLGTKIEQKSLAFDASYSQSFNIGNTRNDIVVGVDYNHFKHDYDQARHTNLGTVDYRDFARIAYVDVMGNARRGVNGYTLTNTKQELTEKGLYGKLVFRPIEKLSLIVGGRVGHYEIKAGDGLTSARASDTNFTGYAGAVFDIVPNHSLYISYSSLHTPQSDTDASGRILKARKGTQVEGGYKGSLFDDKLNLRLTAYRLRDVNAAAPIIPGNARSSSVALGKRVMQGFEAEVSGNLSDKWRVHAGYSYLDTSLVVPTKSDVAIFLMPRHSVNLWTTYDVTEKFTVGMGVNAMSKIRSSQGVSASGYATFDAMVSYAVTPKLKVQLNVDNVFNRQYYARVGSANTFNIPGKDRSVYANVRYSF